MRSLAVLLCVSSLFAQTYVVDSNGGGNFTDLPQAIAAVPSGSTLRVLNSPWAPGVYSPFTIQNKSLTIVGEAGVRVSMTGPVTIGPLNSSQSVHITGISMLALAQPTEVRIHNCAGPVLLEADLGGGIHTFPVTVDVLSSANVHLGIGNNVGVFSQGVLLPTLSIRNSIVEIARSLIYGSRGVPSAGRPGKQGESGIDISQQSVVTLVSSFVIGGPGGGSLTPGLPAGIGGTGVHVSGGSTLTCYGRVNGVACDIRGGQGFPGNFYSGPSSGGFGLVVEQGSTARVLEVNLLGGTGVTEGVPFVSDSTSLLSFDPKAIAPSAFLSGTVAPLATVDYTLVAAPGTITALLTGNDFVAQTPPLLGLGMLAIAPNSILGPFVVPQNGQLAVPSFVPASWPQGVIVGAQFVTFDAVRNQFEVSNSFTATSR